MTGFSEHFRQLVGPRLAALAKLQGTYLAMGIAAFNDAHSAVMAEARRLGACHLPSDKLTELDDWISARLLHEADAIQPVLDEVRELSDRVHAQHMEHIRRFKQWMTR